MMKMRPVKKWALVDPHGLMVAVRDTKQNVSALKAGYDNFSKARVTRVEIREARRSRTK